LESFLRPIPLPLTKVSLIKHDVLRYATSKLLTGGSEELV
jgi:hypothetical protein